MQLPHGRCYQHRETININKDKYTKKQNSIDKSIKVGNAQAIGTQAKVAWEVGGPSEPHAPRHCPGCCVLAQKHQALAIGPQPRAGHQRQHSLVSTPVTPQIGFNWHLHLGCKFLLLDQKERLGRASQGSPSSLWQPHWKPSARTSPNRILI